MLLSKDERLSVCSVCGAVKSVKSIINIFDFGEGSSKGISTTLNFTNIKKKSDIPKISGLNVVLQFFQKAMIYKAGYSTFGYF
jgi:hypothetical protein